MRQRSMHWRNSSYASTPNETHCSDFLDGGEGNDSLIGFGKDDVLYGGASNDLMYGDGYGGTQTADSTYLAAQYQGDELDGGGKGLEFAIQSIANNRHSTLARGRFYSKKQREMGLGTRSFEAKSGLGPYQNSLSCY